MNHTTKIVIAIVLIFSGASFGGTYSGGNGTEAHPYQIGNLGNWQELMITSADWNQHFILTADLNFGGLSLTPVGNSSTSFAGVFDGQGHIISNVVINLPGSYNVGLFGCVDSSGQIRNLGVEGVNITGNSFVGGLVGIINGPLTACYATGSVSGVDNVGGLVGSYYDGGGGMTACYATGSVSGVSNVGGLVGYNKSSLTTCYATGSVSGVSNVGGLVGSGQGSLTSCFWDTQTSGQPISHGGIGLPTLIMQDSEIYLRAFWDFKGEIKNGINDYWAMPQGGGYPVLAWQLGDSPVSNDEMSNAIAVTAGSPVSGTSIAAAGLDITRNGYKDFKDVWYYFDCTEAGKYTITVEPEDFNSTVAVLDGIQTEIVFNDDFFGDKSVVILKAAASQRYYIRVAGYDGQTGNFNLTVNHGAIQAIQGDLNYDGTVNMVDLAIFAEHWLE